MPAIAHRLLARLIASGILARLALLLVALAGIAGAWWGSDQVRALLIRLTALLMILAPVALIVAVVAFMLLLAVARAALRWRQRRQAEWLAVLAQGAQQGRAALLEEVRVVVHGHLKPYLVEIEHHLAAVRAATDTAQRELRLYDLDESVHQLRQQLLRLHGQVAEPIGAHLSPLQGDLERTLREVTWNFRSLLPRVTLEVAGTPRPIPNRLVAALELLLYNALMNAQSHAEAQRVQVRLHYALEMVTLAVSDDGRGFDVARTRSLARGRGLLDLEHTATRLGGCVEIFSIVGQGSEVTMRLPLPRPALGWAAPVMHQDYEGVE